MMIFNRFIALAMVICSFLSLHAGKIDMVRMKAGLSSGDYLLYDEYSLLQEEYKELIRQLAWRDITSKWYKNQELVSHPTVDDTMMKRLVDQASTLLKAYKNKKNTDFVFIGSSLSYMCRAADLLASKKDAYTFDNIAFSGAFMNCFTTIHTGKNSAVYTVKTGESLSKENLKAYWKYLNDCDLHPSDIIARYKEGGKKTVFVDYCVTGNGLASFLYLLFTYALHEKIDTKMLEKAITLHCLLDGELLRMKKVDSFGLYLDTGEDDGELISIDVCSQAISQKLQKNIQQITYILKEEDRLVMHFSQKEWSKKDPFDYKISYYANLALFSLYDWLVNNSLIGEKDA